MTIAHRMGWTKTRVHEVLHIALVHDLPESSCIGDLNYYLKRDPEIRSRITVLESRFRARLEDPFLCGMIPEVPQFNEALFEIVHVSDYIEFTHYALEEWRRGNREGERLAESGMAVIFERISQTSSDDLKVEVEEILQALYDEYLRLGGKKLLTRITQGDHHERTPYWTV